MQTTSKKVIQIVEEIFNSITHGLGAIAAIVGLVLGVIFLVTPINFKVGFIVYCASLIILMIMSTLYHALTFTKAKKVFRVLDHSSIFILIAGSFTPFIIYLYNDWVQILLLTIIWLIAAVGITVSTLFVIPKGMKRTGVILYICFGWMGLLLIPKLYMLSATVIWLLIAGGILYTLGVIPFILKKPFMHFNWHLFVVAAASTHFIAIISLRFL